MAQPIRNYTPHRNEQDEAARQGRECSIAAW